MTITTSDQFINSMGNSSSRIIIDKASLANWAVGNYYSLWRATGQPGQGAIPTTAAACSNTLVGSIGFTQQTPPATSYLGILEAVQPNAAVTLELHDRLGHMGGLSGANNVAQGITLQLDTLGSTANLTARKGDTNYSDVQWWLEWYTATGATASNATVNVTYNDSSSGNLTAFAIGGTAVQATRMIALNNLIPTADSGKYIMRINNITLSASTGTAGSFGATATRYRGAVFMPIANARFTANYADLGLPEIYNSSCLFGVVIAGATTSGIFKATGKVIHG